MLLPLSFAKDGFVEPTKLRKHRRLMIGTDGLSNTGKTEFAISAPGPGIVICLDRGYDAMLDNPHPPETRRGDFAFKAIPIPKATQALKATYMEYWKEFYDIWTKALANPDARTVVLDGDSDSWELQRLAEFGTLTNVPGRPGIAYYGVQAARRVMINKAHDSGKIIIATNKVRAEYAIVRDASGEIKNGADGQPLKEKSGQLERQGFSDQDYLWQIQLRHLYEPAYFDKELKKRVPEKWGIKILKCKSNTRLQGDILWDADCCFKGLVSHVYPHVPLGEWGLE